MTNTNRLQSKCLKLFIIVFTILLSFSSVVSSQSDSEFSLFQKITTSEKNLKGSTIFQFKYNKYNHGLSLDDLDNSTFELSSDPSDQIVQVKLRKPIEGETFTLKITLDSTHKLIINGTFMLCDNPSDNSKTTVIIAFLASLCLILFTALALTLIILRRKKPITFKFGQKEDKDYDRKQFSDNYEENYENSNKSVSIDVTNITNNIITNRSPSLDSPRVLQPRKSSLKPPKNSLTDQFNNNYTSHENGAFNGGELEVVDELNEDKIEVKIEDKMNIQDTRRKSIVTFNDKPEVKNYG